MFTKEYASWKAASSRSTQTNAWVGVRPAGVLNNSTSVMASGVEPHRIHGRRRPHLVLALSTVLPATRSATPAHTLVTA